MNRLSGSPWSAPETVAGFAQARPNETLMRFAAEELRRTPGGRLLDLGCGAGRNAVPLAALDWEVVGLDLAWPMLVAAARRAAGELSGARLFLGQAAMDALPVGDGSCDLVVAHGIWNLARSAAEFRRATAEAARVARPGAGLFVFTFSRHTFPPETAPVAEEPFVFTQFSGEPQCFLDEEQLLAELATAGFDPDPAVPLREHNLARARSLQRGVPVIWEGTFRRR